MKLKQQQHLNVLVIVLLPLIMDKCSSTFGATVTVTAAITGKSKLSGKIYGGRNIDIGQYPSIVGVLQNNWQKCGGTIIGLQIVLTAAHCFARVDSNITYTVRAGSNFRSTGGSIFEVQNYFVHNYYESTNFHYDFAIIKTIRKFDPHRISPLVTRPIPPMTQVWVAGWGASESSEVTEELRRANLITINQHDCKKKVFPYKITSSMLCAMNPKGGIDACTGDSGGPLFWGNQLAGVTSWGVQCGDKYPGIYSNVFSALRWIKGFL